MDQGPRVVALGANPGGPDYSESETEPFIEPPAVIAISYVVGNGLETTIGAMIDKLDSLKVGAEALVAMARADSAIGWSRMPALAPLRKLITHHRDSTQFDSTGRLRRDTSSIVSWSMRSPACETRRLCLRPNAPPHSSRRSCSDWLDYQGQDTMLRRRLEQVGAKYDYAHMGAVYQYVRPWLWRACQLWRAYQLDSTGPAGKVAFAELERVGWTTAVGCGGVIDEVIGRGERASGRAARSHGAAVRRARLRGRLLAGSGQRPSICRRQRKGSGQGVREGPPRAIEHYQVALHSTRVHPDLTVTSKPFYLGPRQLTVGPKPLTATPKSFQLRPFPSPVSSSRLDLSSPPHFSEFQTIFDHFQTIFDHFQII